MLRLQEKLFGALGKPTVALEEVRPSTIAPVSNPYILSLCAYIPLPLAYSFRCRFCCNQKYHCIPLSIFQKIKDNNPFMIMASRMTICVCLFLTKKVLKQPIKIAKIC